MAENGITGKVIGVAFDGTGFGTDGKIWGGEFLVADFAGFERRAHFATFPSRAATRLFANPGVWPSAICWTHSAQQLDPLDLPFLRRVPAKKFATVRTMIERGINTVEPPRAGVCSMPSRPSSACATKSTSKRRPPSSWKGFV